MRVSRRNVNNYGASPITPDSDFEVAVADVLRNAGYEVVASELPPGAYRLVATAHTVATGTFSLSQTVDIVVSEAR